MTEMADMAEALQEQIRIAPGQLIATRIKRARKQADLTLDRLGALCGGVSRQHLIRLEQAKHRPRADMLTRIAGATGRPVEWFLDPEVDPSPFPNEDGHVDGDGRHVARGADAAKGAAAVTLNLRQEAGTA